MELTSGLQPIHGNGLEQSRLLLVSPSIKDDGLR